MPPQALAAVATLLSFAAQGNRIEFKLDHGAAELTWVSDNTFRFRRSLEGPLPAVANAWEPPNAVEVKIDELPGAVRLRTKRIEVRIQKNGLLLSVNGPDGKPLMTDVSEPRAVGDGVEWDRAMPEGVRYYGLEPRDDGAYDWRGRVPQHAAGLLISSAGYGEFHVGGGNLQFDFTALDRYRIRAPGVDYYFYFGPTPKRLFEEQNREPGQSARVVVVETGMIRGTVDTAFGVSFDAEAFFGWQSLPKILMRLSTAAMAGELYGYFNLDDFGKMPPDLLQRARQIGSLVPDVKHTTMELSDFRKQLDTFFKSYETETRDKGYPLWRPLPFEFPDDPECAHHADEFMLGDEMLIAPIYDATGKRSLYLPQGVWTNLETNGVEQGRRTIAVETKALPVFARNGTIVPLDSTGVMALHYFPSLGAEFFLLESAAAAWSQVHAAPAGDILRLEIESKVERDYQLGGAPCGAPGRNRLRRAEVRRSEHPGRIDRPHVVL